MKKLRFSSLVFALTAAVLLWELAFWLNVSFVTALDTSSSSALWLGVLGLLLGLLSFRFDYRASRSLLWSELAMLFALLTALSFVWGPFLSFQG